MKKDYYNIIFNKKIMFFLLPMVLFLSFFIGNKFLSFVYHYPINDEFLRILLGRRVIISRQKLEVKNFCIDNISLDQNKKLQKKISEDPSWESFKDCKYQIVNKVGMCLNTSDLLFRKDYSVGNTFIGIDIGWYSYYTQENCNDLKCTLTNSSNQSVQLIFTDQGSIDGMNYYYNFVIQGKNMYVSINGLSSDHPKEILQAIQDAINTTQKYLCN